MILSSKKDLEESVGRLVRENVYNAFKKVDRKLFVPNRFEDNVYLDTSITLSNSSSISQPTLVAEMIDLLDFKGDEHVLEIGTGSGYSAAILSLCCKEVDTIEIDSQLADSARERLSNLGYKNITVHSGDGAKGIPEKAPFDSIVITAAVRKTPQALVDQIKGGGKIIVPLQEGDSDSQILTLGIKKEDELIEKQILPVRFVPLTSNF